MIRKSLYIPTEDRKILSGLSDIDVSELTSVLSHIKPTTMWLGESFEDFEEFKGKLSNDADISSVLQVLRDATYSTVGYSISKEDLLNDIRNTLIEEGNDSESIDKTIENVSLAFDAFYKGAVAYNVLLEGGSHFSSVNSVINERPVFDESNSLTGYVIGYGLDISYHDRGRVRNLFLNLDIQDLKILSGEIDKLIARRNHLVDRYKGRSIGYYHFPIEGVGHENA